MGLYGDRECAAADVAQQMGKDLQQLGFGGASVRVLRKFLTAGCASSGDIDSWTRKNSGSLRTTHSPHSGHCS